MGYVAHVSHELRIRTYVVNRVSDKLTPLAKNIFCCRSGSAADTQKVADIVRYQLDFHRMVMNCEPTVLEAAVSCRSMCYSYREDLTVGLFVAGWDEVLGGQASYLCRSEFFPKDIFYSFGRHAHSTDCCNWRLRQHLHIWVF